MIDYDLAGLYMVTSWMRTHVIKLLSEVPEGEVEEYLRGVLRDITALEDKLQKGFLEDWTAKA